MHQSPVTKDSAYHQNALKIQVLNLIHHVDDLQLPTWTYERIFTSKGNSLMINMSCNWVLLNFPSRSSTCRMKLQDLTFKCIWIFCALLLSIHVIDKFITALFRLEGVLSQYNIVLSRDWVRVFIKINRLLVIRFIVTWDLCEYGYHIPNLRSSSTSF